MYATALPHPHFLGLCRFTRRFAGQLFPAQPGVRREHAERTPFIQRYDSHHSADCLNHKECFDRFTRLRDERRILSTADLESFADVLPLYGRCGQPEDLRFLENLLDTFPERYDAILALAVFPLLLRFESIDLSIALREWMQALIEEYPHRRSAALARYLLAHE